MFEHVLFVLAICSLCVALAMLLEMAIGGRHIRFLKDCPPPERDFAAPLVSVIVPARNEQRGIEAGLTSLLAQDYPRLEYLVINDRSTDRTGHILESMASHHRQLTVVHLADLPPGWLGKNHAMYVGAERAGGDLLLFTDADVVMESSTIGRAVRYLVQRRIDHLCATPETPMPTRLLQAFVVTFTVFFCAYFRPWKAKDPKSKAHVGIGAFNLIRTSVYRSMGTHEAVRMRPDDDVKLGKLVKTHGYRQDIVHGRELISVRWYASLRELIDGLMKNAFSGADYRVGLVLSGTSFMLMFFVWPFAAVLLTGGWSQLCYASTAGVLLLVYIEAARPMRSPWWLAPLFPIGVVLLAYIVLRAMLLTYLRRGIAWRGTHYSLTELKANKV